MKKIKKRRSDPPMHDIEDPELEVVEEDRKFEVDFDEETNEALLVYHYRRKWGDEFDADVEHALDINECNQLVLTLLSILEKQKMIIMSDVQEKSTPELHEGNPIKESKDVEQEEKKDDTIIE